MKILRILLLIICVICISGCFSSSNLDYVKNNASTVWKSVGYEVIGYDGFQWGFWIPFTLYGGAKVWYSLKRDNNGIIYNGYLQSWGNEIHVYGPKAVDAIKPR
jgi:hypothetical protein